MLNALNFAVNVAMNVVNSDRNFHQKNSQLKFLEVPNLAATSFSTSRSLAYKSKNIGVNHI